MSQSLFNDIPNVSNVSNASNDTESTTFLTRHKYHIIALIFFIGLISLGLIIYYKFYKKNNPVDCKLSDWILDNRCICNNGSSNGYKYRYQSIIEKDTDGGKACPNPDDLRQPSIRCNCSPQPSNGPSPQPTYIPSPIPTYIPSPIPTYMPSPIPTYIPSPIPTSIPTPIYTFPSKSKNCGGNICENGQICLANTCVSIPGADPQGPIGPY
jgi:hypothetical protein